MARPRTTWYLGGAVARAAVIVTAATALVGCGEAGPTPATPPTTPGEVTGDLTVFAAASLTGSFSALGASFERSHPQVAVRFSFAGSSALATQIVEGAPADVFAAASPTTMQAVADAGRTAADPQVFATNTLQIAVPPGNPAGVTGLGDLADPDLTIALCAPQVPCGAAAEQVFAAAGLTPAPDTLDQDVKAVLSKVELGEVDAALVYRTDVLAAGASVHGINMPEAAGVVSGYQITVLEGSSNPVAAQAFLQHVRSTEGREVLTGAGFGGP